MAICISKIPTALYRYRVVGQQLRALINGDHWFASPRSFNDPFDCQLPIRFNPTEKQLRVFLKSANQRLGLPRKRGAREFEALRRLGPEAIQARINEIRRSMVEDYINSASLLCFSTEEANILMFSHYGDFHRGVSVGLNFNALFSTGRVLPVTYSDTYPELDFFKLRANPTDLLQAVFLTKAKLWEYESEWRFIRYNEPAGPARIDPHWIQSITFGCACTSQARGDVELWCRAAGISPAFRSASKSGDGFRLEVS